MHGTTQTLCNLTELVHLKYSRKAALIFMFEQGNNLAVQDNRNKMR